MYGLMRSEVDAGGRVYIVCPFVETSRAAGFEEVKAAETEFERLKVRARPHSVATLPCKAHPDRSDIHAHVKVYRPKF